VFAISRLLHSLRTRAREQRDPDNSKLSVATAMPIFLEDARVATLQIGLDYRQHVPGRALRSTRTTMLLLALTQQVPCSDLLSWPGSRPISHDLVRTAQPRCQCADALPRWPGRFPCWLPFPMVYRRRCCTRGLEVRGVDFELGVEPEGAPSGSLTGRQPCSKG
jgi:hypothetical protein